MQYLAVIVKASLQSRATIYLTTLLSAVLTITALPHSLAQEPPIHSSPLAWHAGPPIPDALGIAGPIVGVHNDILIAGGGANFAQPVWESTKRWHDKLYALDLRQSTLTWHELSPMPAAWGYSACISTPQGIVVVGGNDSEKSLATCWLIGLQRTSQANKPSIRANFIRLPDLPEALANGQGALVQDAIWICTGQTGNDLSSATAALWQLAWPFAESEFKLASAPSGTWRWQRKSDHPGGARSFAQVARLPVNEMSPTLADNLKGKPDGALIVIGGRRQEGDQVRFLSDTWIYEPASDRWQRRSDAPVPITAGTAASIAADRIAVISGDDGQLFTKTDQLRDRHPGFAHRSWIYDATGDRWQGSFETPANQVTTSVVPVGDELWLISGEIRPRVRTPNVWKISVVQRK